MSTQKRYFVTVFGMLILCLFILATITAASSVFYTVERYKGSNFSTDFRIINHKKRDLTKPKEIIEAIKTGTGLSSMVA